MDLIVPDIRIEAPFAHGAIADLVRAGLSGRVPWLRRAFGSLMADMADRAVGLAAAAVQLVGGIEGQLSFGWQLPSVAARKKGLIGRCGVGYRRASDPRPTLDRP